MSGIGKQKKDGINAANRDEKSKSSRRVYDTKLFDAVARAQTGVIRDLLGERQGGSIRRAKANINARDDDGLTPLILACQHRNYVVIKVLLRGGAHPSMRENQKGLTPLHCIADAGDIESLKLVLAYHAEIDLPDVTGCTPLHYAASRKNVDATDLLVFCGANAFKKDMKGVSPISACDDVDICKTLKESEHIQHGLINKYVVIEHIELISDSKFHLEKIGLTVHTRPLFGVTGPQVVVKDRFDCFSISFLCRRIRPEYSKTCLVPGSKELLLSDTFEWRMSATRGDGTVDLEIPIYEPPDPFEDIFIKTDIKPTVDDSCKLDRFRRIENTNKWVCWATIDLKNVRAFVIITKPKVEYCNFNPLSKGGQFKSSVDDFIIIDIMEETFGDSGDVTLEVTPCPMYKEEEFNAILSCSNFYDINHTEAEQPKNDVSITLPVPRDYDGSGSMYVLGGNCVEDDDGTEVDEDGLIIENYNWEILKKNIQTTSGKVSFKAQHFTTMAITEATPGSSEESIKEQTERIARKARKRQTSAVIIAMLKPTIDPARFDVVVECTKNSFKRVLDRQDHWFNDEFRDQKPSVSTDFLTLPNKGYSVRVGGNAKKIVPNTSEAVLEFHPHRDNHTQFQVERVNDESNDVVGIVNVYNNSSENSVEEKQCITSVHIHLSGTLITMQENLEEDDMAFKGFTNNKLLRYLSEKLGQEWIKVCILLGLSYQKVEDVRTDSTIKEPNDKKFKVLRMWREMSKQRQDTYGVPELLAALRRSGRNDIVEELHYRLKNWLDEKNEERDKFYEWLEKTLNTCDLAMKEGVCEPMSDQFLVMLVGKVTNLQQLGPILNLTKPEIDNIFMDSLIPNHEQKLLQMLIKARNKRSSKGNAFQDLLEGMEVLHMIEGRNWVIESTKEWLETKPTEDKLFVQSLIEYLTDISELDQGDT